MLVPSFGRVWIQIRWLCWRGDVVRCQLLGRARGVDRRVVLREARPLNAA